MIIDFHVHAFPSIIRDSRNFYFLDEPEFKTLYGSSKDRIAGCSEIISMMNNCKIDISVVFGFPWRNYNTCRINNNYIIEIVQRYPSRFRGFCCVDPFHPMAAKEVERCLELGLSGVGEIAFYERGIDNTCRDVLEPIMNICLTYDCPILIHTNEEVGHSYRGKTKNTMGQIYNTIKRFPQNKIVLAHWGGGIFFFNLLKHESANFLANVYYDIAATPFLYKKQIYGIAKEIIGVNKIILGTDFPLIYPNRYLVDIYSSGLRKSEIDKICFKNAALLLNL